jgi:hypothetical protein
MHRKACMHTHFTYCTIKYKEYHADLFWPLSCMIMPVLCTICRTCTGVE